MSTDHRPPLHVVTAGDKAPPPQQPLVYTPGFHLYNRPPSQIPWLVQDLIPRHCTFCINGRGGIYKSWFMTALGIGVATGHYNTVLTRTFMDHFKIHVDPPFNSVLFVQLEEEKDEASDKYRYLMRGMGLGPMQIQDALMGYVVGQPFRVDDAKRMDQMKILIDESQPDLVLWDNARKMKRGNENDSEWADEIAFRLKELQEVYPSAHGLIHHWRKKSGDKEKDDISEMGRGSAALRDAMSVWLPVQEHPDGFLTMTVDKMRGGPKIKPFNYLVRISQEEQLAKLEYIGSATDATSANSCSSQIMLMMEAQPTRTWTQPEVINQFAGLYSRDQVGRAIRALELLRKLTVFPSKGGKPTTITLRANAPGLD